MSMFFGAIIFLLVAANYYIAKRLHKGVLNKIPFIVILAFLLISAAVTLFGIAGKVVDFGAYWMGIFAYLVMFFIVAEIVWLFVRLLKVSSDRYWFVAGVVVLILTAAASGAGIYNAQDIDTVTYQVPIGKNDASDMNIVLVSDIHLGAVGSEDRLSEIVDKINEQKPDIVCIAGDFFDTDYNAVKNPEKAIDEIKRISSTYGVYMCLGNHDAGKTVDKMIDFTQKAGITLLNDEYVIIDDRLVLLGRLDGNPIGGYGNARRDSIETVLGDYDKELPVIVMDHNPINIGEYTNEVDLILCGHTHKGQIFPMSIITDMIFEVDYGYYRRDANSPHVIVTSGVGYWGLPMRVGANCEVVNIKIN